MRKLMNKFVTCLTAFTTMALMCQPFATYADESIDTNDLVYNQSGVENVDDVSTDSIVDITTDDYDIYTTTTTTTATTTTTTDIQTTPITTTESTTLTDEPNEHLTGYIDVLYPEQTTLLGKSTCLNQIWLKLVVMDDDNNPTVLREFNTKFDEHTCYTIDTSNVDVNTPGTYQYTVKSIGGVTETFAIPNDTGWFDHYDIEMIDYEVTVTLTVSEQYRKLSLNADDITIETGRVYQIEIYDYKSDEISVTISDEKVASTSICLENESSTFYTVRALAEGNTTITFNGTDGQTATLNVTVVPKGSIATTVVYTTPATTTETTTTTTETTATTSSVSTDENDDTTITTTETTTVCPSPNTTTTTPENNDDLPQTGMPWARAAEGLAVVLTVGGAIVALKSRKK